MLFHLYVGLNSYADRHNYHQPALEMLSATNLIVGIYLYSYYLLASLFFTVENDYNQRDRKYPF